MWLNKNFMITLAIDSQNATHGDNLVILFLHLEELIVGISQVALGEGNGNPCQYCCLENPMDRGAWWTTVHGVTKSQTRLSD